MIRQKIALFGGGPACLMAALLLSQKQDVVLYEKEKSVGRKFLVAGKGGFNLTNQAIAPNLLSNYAGEGIEILHKALQFFDTTATRKWLLDLGIETYVGTSGRVFPKKGIKPAEVLHKITERLAQNGVEIRTNHAFTGFDAEGVPLVETGEGVKAVLANHYFFGLGGGSWSKTGSDGKWQMPFNQLGIKTAPFRAANCGVCVGWTTDFIEKHAGKPLKNIALRFDEVAVKGEVIITRYGLEGNAVYPLASVMGKALEKGKSVRLKIDFKPNNTLAQLEERVKGKVLKPKNYAYVFKLDKPTLELIKLSLSKSAYLDPLQVVQCLKSCVINIHALRDLEEAISTVGGVLLNQLNDDFTLKCHPQFSLIGEMLDWDAPTGGYLLQGCFSTAYTAAQKWT